ncbi:MAG: DUF4012 domain-containing protein [bacterium]|nr:DUF4012 domain-containing protein [bacterium]
MIKGGKKRPQLRRCAHCDKPGHNKQTCPLFLVAPTPIIAKPSREPIHFFIHHTAGQPIDSPHRIDLAKKTANIWADISAVVPAENDDPIGRFYQERKNTNTIHDSLNTIQKIPQNNDNQTSQILDPRFRGDDSVETPISKKIKPNPFTTISKFLNFLISQFFNFIAALRDQHARVHAAIKAKLSLPRLIKMTAVILLLTILPAQANSYYFSIKTTADQVAADSTIGFSALQESTAAMMNADLGLAQDSLNIALSKFQTAADTLQTQHQWLIKIASGIPFLKDEVQSKQNILLAGQKIALGNLYLLKGIAESKADNKSPLLARFNALTVYLKSALPNYKQAVSKLDGVNENTLPLQYQRAFRDFHTLFGAIVNDVQTMADLGGTINEIFGGKGLRRYLLVFQNNNELRPTGGFIGSFAIIDVKDGNIINLEIPPGGSYDLQGQLTANFIPPAPLLLSNNRWEFQDANWFPDFSLSAQKLLWFYRKSRNVTADGVIAINATVLERLLAIMGPVTDDKRGLVLTSENALNSIQQIVETGPEKIEHKPKQIIADLAPKFVEYLTNAKPENVLPLLTNLRDALAEKAIQVYFTDSNTEKNINAFGWGGKILPTTAGQDYLMVVNTNIQGQKSDARMKQTITHQAIIQTDGSIIDSVVVTREHTGAAGEIMYGQTNIDYIRLYIPTGSELISAGGFTWPDENKFKAPRQSAGTDEMLVSVEQEVKYDEASGTRITNELGKTAFGNWIITEPGQTSQVQFVYRLPFKAFAPDPTVTGNQLQKIFSDAKNISKYQLIVQRQSGSETTFANQTIWPDGWKPNWKNGNNITLAANGASIATQPLTTDSVWSVAMTK